MTPQVCWIDSDWDRSRASDGISRYGAYLRSKASEFTPWYGEETPDGITREPGEFAAAAFRVATGPIMSPGYVNRHDRVLGLSVGRGDGGSPDWLVCQVTLAIAQPTWLGSPWRDWTSYLGRDWCEPDEDKRAVLTSQVLRWPLPVAGLPVPSNPVRSGVPNLADAIASVRALVAAINATVGPVLARLEGGAS